MFSEDATRVVHAASFEDGSNTTFGA